MTAPGEVLANPEITTANFGEVLLFAYAGFMRQIGQDQEIAANLRMRAVAAEETLFGAMADGMQEGQGLEVLDLATRSLGLRELAKIAENLHGGDYKHFPNCWDRDVRNKKVTVTPLEGRNRPETEEFTGFIWDINLRPGYSRLTVAKRLLLGNTRHFRELVDPVDFQANVKLQFHE